MKLLKGLRLNKKLREPMTYGTYCLLYRHNAIGNHDEIMERVEKPTRLCGQYLPDDLNHITMGALVDVLECEDDIKVLATLYNLTTGQIKDDRATNVLGAIKWTTEQIKSITGLWKQLERDFTVDELMAGADKMKSDIFSTIDWYARRMGISDHDEVLKVSWIKIWRCAKDDRARDEYRERLNNIMNKKK